MCQANLYSDDSERQKLLLEDVARLEIKGNEVAIQPLFGEAVSLSARIKEIDLMKHRIVVETM